MAHTCRPRHRVGGPDGPGLQRIPLRSEYRGMRVGMVLGAGGVVGASWLIGALEALESETGWRASDAEHIVGTSAGSVIGTLVASGIPAEYVAAYAGGRSLDGIEPPPGLELDVAELEAREAGEGYPLGPPFPPHRPRPLAVGPLTPSQA